MLFCQKRHNFVAAICRYYASNSNKRINYTVYNERNGSFTSRMAEVISILQMYVSGADVPYVALRYLDDRSYGCIPYEQVTEVCDESFSE